MFLTRRAPQSRRQLRRQPYRAVRRQMGGSRRTDASRHTPPTFRPYWRPGGPRTRRSRLRRNHSRDPFLDRRFSRNGQCRAADQSRLYQRPDPAPNLSADLNSHRQYLHPQSPRPIQGGPPLRRPCINGLPRQAWSANGLPKDLAISPLSMDHISAVYRLILQLPSSQGPAMNPAQSAGRLLAMTFRR